MTTTTTQQQQQPKQEEAQTETLIDFDSDEPLAVCPMRKDGMAPGEICEACQ